MPGSNCAIVKCGTHRGTNKVLSFFKIRQPKYPQWEAALVNAVNRSDPGFNKDQATICSRHFTPDCIKESKKGRRSLVPGSLPTEWMPEKSIVTPKPPPRKNPTEREAPPVPQLVAYYNFTEVKREAGNLPKPWVLLNNTEQEIVMGVFQDNSLRLQVKVLSDFSTSVFVFGFPVKDRSCSIEDTPLSKFLNAILDLKVCTGVSDPELQMFADLPKGQKTQLYFKHVTYLTADDVPGCKQTVRSTACQWLQKDTDLCEDCIYARTLLLKKSERAKASNLKPIAKNNPLFTLSKEKLKEGLKSERKHSAKIQKELDTFKQSLNSEAASIVGPKMHKSLKKVLDDKKGELQPLQKLFWEEQVKAFNCKDKRGMRWHPSMIRLAILIHSRSSAAYDTLQKTGVLHLPSESTLQDYTNVSCPAEGFTNESMDNIRHTARGLKDHQRFVVLLHDEMSIKSDLVFDKRTGELVGFIKVDEKKRQLATHVLVFYVVGVNSSLSASMGYFSTKTATADTLFPLFWKAVGMLERSCDLKVIASVSDKGTPNQRLYDMHATGNEANCYKTKNLFARDRYIYFISDPPHLMKTVRNNLNNSGGGTRYLWVKEQHILWQHFVDLYRRDCGMQVRMTKLTAEHVYLTPASVMNVRLAAQVLSERVGKVLTEFGGPECRETAKFVLLMDQFFDCMNGRSKKEGARKRKPNLKPYTDQNDDRFQNVFQKLLDFLLNWRDSVQRREGFTQTEKNKMMLSLQTIKGLLITLKAFPEAVKYLLSQGVEYVLGNRFCQDPVEKHFGRHRSLGRRCDNPSLWAFGYGENKLRMSRTLSLAIQPKGNVTQKRKAHEDFVVYRSPMKKRKRH